MQRVILRYPPLIKTGLVIVALVLAFGTVWYTSQLVRQLESRQRQVAGIWASALEKLASADDSSTDLTFIFEEIVTTIDFPVIVTTPEQEPIPGFYRNIEFPELASEEERQIYLRGLVSDYDRINQPIEVRLNDSLVLQVIHFGHSGLVEQLRWFPFVQITSVAVFIILGYVAFSMIRKQEQSSVWVGMSKETAHQLGTPLSGLLAWIEVLKTTRLDPEAGQIIDDMQTDVNRLLTVTDRFSKIGSKPALENRPLKQELEQIISYMQRRISSKSVEITLQCPEDAQLDLNAVLFQWAIENLIKNSADAGATSILIRVEEDSEEFSISVDDNGKGMSRQQSKNIFRPGYTTKTRGWGMGLSLTRRIVELYHNGKIRVARTVEGEGTTIKMVFPFNRKRPEIRAGQK